MNPNSEQKRIAFGYDRDHGRIVVNEGQAAAVQLIYLMYADGKCLSEIKETFESLCVPSPRNGKAWGKQTVSNILSNPHYLGAEEYPALIARDLFDRVQEIKQNRTK